MAEMNRNRTLKQKITANLTNILLIGIVIWFLTAFLVYPVADVIRDSIWVDGTFNSKAFEMIFTSERAVRAVQNSILLAIVLTFTANVVGTFIVLVTDYFDIKGATILRIAFMSTLVLGGLVLNNGYLFVYGETGVVTQFLAKIFPKIDIGWFNGFPAVLFVMTFGVTHNHTIFLRNAISDLDMNIIDAARNLGSSQWEILKGIVFPTIRPTIITLIIMTFATGLGAFAAPLMVGGKEFQTITPLILTFSQRPGSQDLAAILSIILGLSQVILLLVLTINERKSNFVNTSKSPSKFIKQKIKNPIANFIIHTIAYVLFVIYLLPPVMVILFSFMDTSAITEGILSLDGFTLEHYNNILSSASTYGPLIRSALYSGVAAIVSVLICLVVVRFMMRYKSNNLVQSLELPFFIPWLLPSVLIALGYVLTYDSPNPLLFGNSVIGATWIMPIAYSVVVLPQTMRYIKAAYLSFNTSLEDASKNLGASGFRTFFQIIVPILFPTILALIALNFNTNLAEYNMSVFLYQPSSTPIGVVIQQNSAATATVDSKAINLVYSVVLMIVSSLSIYFVYGRGSKVNKRRGGIES